MTPRGRRLLALLLHLYPRAFQRAYRADLLAFAREDWRHPRYGSGWRRPWRFWRATIGDMLRTAWRLRVDRGASGHPTVPAHAGSSLAGRLRLDLRYAWRGLRSSAGTTTAALAVLALGIGAGTTIFSVADAVMLRGLPFPESSRLLSIAETDIPRGNRPVPAALPDFEAWRARQDVFEDLGASASAGAFLTAGPGPVIPLRAVLVSPSLFSVLRVTPALGRGFQSADTIRGAVPRAIISDRVWRTRFQASPSALGRILALDNGPREIIGVMPPGFTYPLGSVYFSHVDLWIPLVSSPAALRRDGGRNFNLSVVGRLRPGATLARASAEMTGIRGALAAEFPKWFADRGIVVRPLDLALIGATVRAWMWFLLGAVAVVLLIACLNVANLLMARAASRTREIALRAALGASRWDLTRALLVESLLLASLGSMLGVLLAFWGVSVLRASLPAEVPRLATAVVDLRVLGAAAIAALVTGVCFGTLPAMQLARPDVSDALRDGSPRIAGGAGPRVRALLVGAQVALAAVLLAGAGLFLASFLGVMRMDLGLDPAGVVSVDVDFPRLPRQPDGRADVERSQTMLAGAVARARQIPGVTAAAAIAFGLPLSGNSMTVEVQPIGSPVVFSGPDEAFVHGVTRDYLEVVHGSLVAGRWFAGGDGRGAEPVTVLSDEAARRYFGAQDPIGQRLTFVQFEPAPRTVVGVIRGMRVAGPEADPQPEAYIPLEQSGQSSADIVVRSVKPPSAIGPDLRAALQSFLPASAVVDEPETLETFFSGLVAQRKFNMVVLSIFGTLALVIAAIGLYGLMAFVVAERTREIGIRIALGALPATVRLAVLSRASALLIGGLVGGLVAAAAGERVVRAFLFHVPPHDLRVYGASAAVLLVAGLLAAAVPAMRASRVDPIVALREP